MPDVFFIIQGPLITYGQGPNNNRSGFDAYGSIERNYKLLTARGINVILTTWKEDNNEQHNVHVDKIERLGLEVYQIEKPARFDPDHRYKHHYSIRTTIEKVCNTFEVNYFCKIRTDQEINTNILDFILGNVSQGKMIISELMIDNPFYMGDFIYAGRKDVFFTFLKSQTDIVFPFAFPIIANDIGIKYFSTVYKKSAFATLILYLFSGGQASREWKTFHDNNIITLKQTDWNNILWRGKGISTIIDSKYFLFSNDSSKSESIGRNYVKDYFFGLIKYTRKIFVK